MLCLLCTLNKTSAQVNICKQQNLRHSQIDRIFIVNTCIDVKCHILSNKTTHSAVLVVDLFFLLC